MRPLLFLLLLLPALVRADAFAKANQAYAAGNYAEARQGYAEVLKHGHFANVWFNDGNAAYRLNLLGQAALAYERALLAQPAHPEAAANLKFVRDKSGARVALPPWQEKAWRYVTQPAATWLLIGEAWLGFALIGAAVLRQRRSRGLLVGGVLLLVLGAGGLAALHFTRAELANLAVVVADRADARTEPADKSSLAEALPAGSRVQIVSEQGEWTYCMLPGEGRGWFRSATVERILPAGAL